MKKIITFALLVLALALVACGGGSETTSTESAGPVTLNFEGQDIAFDTTAATVTTGQEVTISFANVGTLEHSWVLLPPGTDALTATDADAFAGATTGTVAGGESKSFTFTAPGAGSYQFVCTIEGHAAAGMVGTLTVK